METIKDILLYQKEILQNEFLILPFLEKYKVIFYIWLFTKKDGLSPDRVASLMSNRLLDRVYEKFNCEEEDFMKALQDPGSSILFFV